MRLAVGAELLSVPEEELLWFHAGSNDCTVGVTAAQLRAYFASVGREFVEL